MKAIYISFGLILTLSSITVAQENIPWSYTATGIRLELSGVPETSKVFRVRIGEDPNVARLWMDEVPQFGHREYIGDKKAIRALSVGKGIGKTSVLEFVFDSRINIKPNDFTLQAKEGKTFVDVRISEELIQQWNSEESVAPVIVTLDKRKAIKVATEIPNNVKKTEEEVSKLPVKSDKTMGFIGEHEVDEEPESQEKSYASLIILLLALVSGAAAFGVIKVKKAKLSGVARTDSINIVDSKRLGPKHQLMLVNVDERNYLISVNGSSATKLASLPRECTSVSDAPQSDTEPNAKEKVPGPFESEIRRLSLVQKSENRFPEAASGIMQLKQRLDSLSKAV